MQVCEVVVPPARSRAAYAVALIAVIAAGLGSRMHGVILPSLLKKSAGDILWTTAVYLILCLCTPRKPVLRVAAESLAISWVDEFSQAYHRPWLDRLRSNPIVHLILGSEFSWHDMGAYVVGMAIGVIIDKALLTLSHKHKIAPNT